MTMTDTILFVKETQTCHYVLHIATPRLCGEPGFKSRLDAREETFIRCREVVDAEEYESADRSLPPAAHPFKLPKRSKPVISPPPEQTVASSEDESPKTPEDLLRRALERFLARGGGLTDPQIVIERFEDGEDELFIEFVDADLILNDGVEGAEGVDGDTFTLDGEALADILRAAGYDIKGEKDKTSSQKKQATGSNEETNDDGGEDTKTPLTQRRDEL